MSLLHKITLSLIKGVGPATAKGLLAKFGSIDAIFSATKSMLLKVEGIGEKTANAILSHHQFLERGQSQLDFIEKHQIEVLFYGDANYPKRLKNCYDAPLLLYYKGNVSLNQQRIVSIVGTRNATAYGKQLCKALITELQPYGVLVMSGLAHGIDAMAHKECLSLGMPTVGVLGHGLDRIYPAAHRGLAQKMLTNGGLLTEFLPGTSPDRENFPKRNRIIAGIADVVIVVEASLKGGALITAEIANSYNRDVYAFPGRTNDEFSAGCNFLIKTNRAGLINHARDLIYYLGWDDQPAKKEALQAQLPLNYSQDEQEVIHLLQQGELSMDQLGFKTAWPQSKLAMVLLTLEMQGILIALPGKLYRLS